MTKRPYIKTCRCGNALRGSDAIGLRSVCSACVRSSINKQQKDLVAEETKRFQRLAKEARARGDTEFKSGCLYFKITPKGFYHYGMFKGKEVIYKKYKFDEE